jgi:prepilin-type processing-associated H-X9-DG protein
MIRLVASQKQIPMELGGAVGAIAFDPARHGRNYNQLFCDGHVSAMSPWVIFNPTNSAVMWNYDHEPHPEYWSNFSHQSS